MASNRPTSTSQLPAQARRRAEHLVELYEREAYRTYNLALRITCDEAAADRATESAFLRHVASGSTEDEQAQLIRETVSTALNEAPRSLPEAGGEDPVAKAVAALPPSQRAIIALHSLDQTPQAIAAAIGAPPHTAASLTDRAREALATKLQIDVDFVGKRLQEWTLAEPPQAIWESLYPKAHRLLTERETPAGTTGPAKKSKPSGSALATRVLEGSPSFRRRFAGGLRGRGGVWAFRGAVLAIILVPAVAVALTGPGSKGDGNVALSATGGGAVPGVTGTGDDAEHSEGGSTYDALTPKELDQLRLKELDELRQYSQQQADKSLSQGARSDAEAQAQQLLELARQRLAEADRRQQQVAAQEQQKQPASKPPTTTAPTTTTPIAPGTTTTPTVPGKKKKKKKKGQATTPPPDSVSSCLFDPESGTYICPQ